MKAERATQGRPTYAMRLGKVERQVISAAAAQTGEAMSAYIRRVAMLAARRELANAGK
jgi:AraC-like DNA-binding protein